MTIPAAEREASRARGGAPIHTAGPVGANESNRATSTVIHKVLAASSSLFISDLCQGFDFDKFQSGV
jgi:hypothetical protein